MLKKIPKSDISIRPFKAYKEWSFSSGSTDIFLFEATDGDYLSQDTTTSNGITFNKRSLYGQLKAQFYNGHEDNPFLRFGRKTNVWTDVESDKERYLNNSAKVISIPQKFIGEGIKPGSLKLTVTDTSDAIWEISDDSYGNLTFNISDVLNVSKLDFETGDFHFTNYYTGVEYTTSVDLNYWDLDGGQITITSGGIDYTTTLYSWDANATPSLMYVENLPFLDSLYGTRYLGNVFYSQGIVTITRSPNTLLTNTKSWSLKYKSTETIYEHEYLCVVNEDEFNVSTNPTAIFTVGEETETFTDSFGVTRIVTPKPGISYIRKRQVTDTGEYMDFSFKSTLNPNISGGFEHWDTSGSIDITGSFLAPFITTVGLYDDNADLVLVAKLPKPIKSLPDVPINFIVRFDT